MATLTMTPTTVRQPFASLDAPRVRSLLKTKMNIKNKQNGAIMSSKRQPLSDVDSENIDPVSLNHSAKRKRGSDDDDIEPIKGPSKPIKASRVALTTVKPSVTTSPRTPTATSKAAPSTPKSAPVLKPAGRSPQAKSSKPSARRSTIAKSRPSSASKTTLTRPISLAAALSNSKPKAQPAKPASWSFDIYVDSEQEEMTNLMQHSTGVLDISDDESKAESTTRGKENIPPAELGLSLARSLQQESAAAAARKSIMQEESRAPLGELTAADYYGEDCHAFSYTVVYDEEDAAAEKPAPAPRSQTSRSKLSSVSSISSLLDATAPKKSTESIEPTEPSATEVEIWESGSAAEEAEAEAEPSS